MAARYPSDSDDDEDKGQKLPPFLQYPEDASEFCIYIPERTYLLDDDSPMEFPPVPEDQKICTLTRRVPYLPLLDPPLPLPRLVSRILQPANSTNASDPVHTIREFYRRTREAFQKNKDSDVRSVWHTRRIQVLELPIVIPDYKETLGRLVSEGAFKGARGNHNVGALDLCLSHLNEALTWVSPKDPFIYLIVQERAQVLGSLGFFDKAEEDVKWATSLWRSLYPEQKQLRPTLIRIRDDLVFARTFKLDKVKTKEEVHSQAQRESAMNALGRLIPSDWPTISGPPNASLPNVTSKVRTKWGKNKRLHLSAVSPIAPGEVVIFEKPLAQALNPALFMEFCQACFSPLDLPPQLFPCETCSIVVFCSLKCRSSPSADIHRSECHLLPLFLNFPDNEQAVKCYYIYRLVDTLLEYGERAATDAAFYSRWSDMPGGPIGVVYMKAAQMVENPIEHISRAAYILKVLLRKRPHIRRNRRLLLVIQDVVERIFNSDGFSVQPPHVPFSPPPEEIAGKSRGSKKDRTPKSLEEQLGLPSDVLADLLKPSAPPDSEKEKKRSPKKKKKKPAIPAAIVKESAPEQVKEPPVSIKKGIEDEGEGVEEDPGPPKGGKRKNKKKQKPGSPEALEGVEEDDEPRSLGEIVVESCSTHREASEEPSPKPDVCLQPHDSAEKACQQPEDLEKACQQLQDVEKACLQPEDVEHACQQPEDLEKACLKPEDVKKVRLQPEDVEKDGLQPEDVKKDGLQPEDVEKDGPQPEDVEKACANSKDDAGEVLQDAPIVEAQSAKKKKRSSRNKKLLKQAEDDEDGIEYVLLRLLDRLLSFPTRAWSSEMFTWNLRNEVNSVWWEQCFVGMGVYPMASLMEHDCYGNCVASFKGKDLVITSVRSIPAGAALTLCKERGHDTDFVRTDLETRAEALKTNFGIEPCKCQACEYRWPNYDHLYKKQEELRPTPRKGRKCDHNSEVSLRAIEALSLDLRNDMVVKRHLIQKILEVEVKNGIRQCPSSDLIDAVEYLKLWIYLQGNHFYRPPNLTDSTELV